MIIHFDTSSAWFQYVFSGTLFVLSLVLFALAAYAWTGPTGTPPADNVAAPINVGDTSQIKSGGLGVGSLVVSGGTVINSGTQPGLQINTTNQSPWALIIRNASSATRGIEMFQYNNGNSIIYNGYGSSYPSYLYFTTSGVYVSPSLCLGGSCRSSFAPTCVTRSNTCYVAHGQACVASCGSGEVMTGGGGQSSVNYDQQCAPSGNGFVCYHYANGGYGYLYTYARCCY